MDASKSSQLYHSKDLRLAHLAYERGGRDFVDDGKARPSAPGRCTTDRILGDHRFEAIPVVRGPYVAGRVTATSVIIWMLPLWNTWMASPGFVPGYYEAQGGGYSLLGAQAKQ